MFKVSEPQLAGMACALELDQHRTGCWTAPSRLLVLDHDPADGEVLDVALATGTVRWARLGDGNPYHLLETAVIAPATAAVALLTHGWAFPPDDPLSWYGRPSRHPGRVRVRTVTVASREGSHCSAIRLQHGDVIVDRGGGGGPLLEALLAVWLPPAPVAPSVRPARCRRDG